MSFRVARRNFVSRRYPRYIVCRHKPNPNEPLPDAVTPTDSVDSTASQLLPSPPLPLYSSPRSNASHHLYVLPKPRQHGPVSRYTNLQLDQQQMRFYKLECLIKTTVLWDSADVLGKPVAALYINIYARYRGVTAVRPRGLQQQLLSGRFAFCGERDSRSCRNGSNCVHYQTARCHKVKG